MDNSLILELHIFLTSIYGGIIAGLVYDLYRTIRYHSKPNKFITYIQDFLFWLIITYVFFYTLIKINWGQIRGYIVLGFLMGVIIYIITFSKYIYPLAVKVAGAIKKIIKGIIYLILYPFKYMKRKTCPTLNKFRKVPIEIIREIKKYKKIISSKK